MTGGDRGAEPHDRVIRLVVRIADAFGGCVEGATVGNCNLCGQAVWIDPYKRPFEGPEGWVCTRCLVADEGLSREADRMTLGLCVRLNEEADRRAS